MSDSPHGDPALKGVAFRELHRAGTFIMPCAWNVLSARMFERAGFAAIGTTSGGVNWCAGRPDYTYSTPQAEMLASYGQIAGAVTVGTSGDLENGYSNEPEDVAKLIDETIGHGMVGGSIEDHDPETASLLVPVELAVEKIAAAREAADRSGTTFTITARSEALYANVHNRLDVALERAARYVEAGADCIFFPGLGDLVVIGVVVDSIGAPLSVGIGSGGSELTVASLSEAGVRRISTGGAVPRAVFNLVEQACAEMLRGSFGFAGDAMSEVAINQLCSVDASRHDSLHSEP